MASRHREIVERFYPLRVEPGQEGWLDRQARLLVAAAWPLAAPLAAAWLRHRMRLRRRKDGGDLRQVARELRRRSRLKGAGSVYPQAVQAALAELGLDDVTARQAGAAALALCHGWLLEVPDRQVRRAAVDAAAIALAIGGRGVHLMVAEPADVEAARLRLEPHFHAFGLVLAGIGEGDDPQARRQAYGADTTVVSARQAIYDFLNDRLMLADDMADLRLATLPLRQEADRQGPLMRGLPATIIEDADLVLLDAGRVPVSVSGAGESAFDAPAVRQALALAAELEETHEFQMTEAGRSLTLTDAGRARLAERCQPLGSFWQSPRRREQLVVMALSAQRLVLRDRDYVVEEGRLHLVDPSTGQPSAGRSWGNGLQQMVEGKEGLPLSRPQVTLAQLTVQAFFRRYLVMGGVMPGLAGSAGELRRTYGCRTGRFGRPCGVRLDLRVVRDVDAQIRQLEPLVAEGWRVAVRSPALAQNLEEELGEGSVLLLDRSFLPSAAERMVVAEICESRRQERFLAGGRGALRMILSLEDPALRNRAAVALLARYWPMMPGRGGLAWLAARWAGRQLERRDARLRRAQAEVEAKRRKTLAFSGRGI